MPSTKSESYRVPRVGVFQSTLHTFKAGEQGAMIPTTTSFLFVGDITAINTKLAGRDSRSLTTRFVTLCGRGVGKLKKLMGCGD